MLTPEQLAEHRAAATIHNEEVKAQLRALVETISAKLDEAIVTADKLVIFTMDGIPRLRDVLITASSQYKMNLDQVVRPLIEPPAPPATPPQA